MSDKRKQSGGQIGSGAVAHLQRQDAPAPPPREDHEIFLTRPELLELLRIGAEATSESLLELPVCVLPNGEHRWLKSQVLTWAALGGSRPRHQRRGVRRVEV